MIHKIETSARGLELNETINGYVQQKIGDLDRYLQRHARKTVHAEVKLWKEKGKGGRGYTAEVIVFLPNDQLTAKETASTIEAAIDGVQDKVKQQLRKYKEMKTSRKTVRHQLGRAFSRLARRSSTE